MESIRINRDRVWDQFSSNPSELLDCLRRYFRYWDGKLAGRWMPELADDADLVYDWPDAPEMLSAALNIPPKKLRGMLGRTRFLVCKKCRNRAACLG